MQNRSRHSSLAPQKLFNLYRNGELSAVSAALDEQLAAGGALSPELVNLRARLFIAKDPPAGLQFLTRHSRSFKGSAQAEAVMLTGVLHARSSDDRIADISFRKAADLLAKLDAPALQHELTYHRAVLLWTTGQFDEANRLAKSLALAPTKDVRVRAKMLESLLASSREQYLEQAGLSLEAFRLAMDNDDVQLQAYATRNIATLARELPLPQLREIAKGAVERVPWTVDFRDEQFKALKAAGWCCALDGDYLNAFRLLKAASAVAPSSHWRVMAALDRAYLARCLGEPRWSEQELLEAHTLALDLDWRGRTHEEHVALVLLAELYAERDASVALAYLAKFRELGPVLNRLESFSYDRRLGALADYSTGVVHARLGNRDEALAALQASWKVFSAVNYDWRAGRSALELFRLTRKTVWNDRAREKLVGYPMSWLAADTAAERVAEGPLAKLSPAQRRVFELLVGGKSTDEVADGLSRSVFTVRNHIRAIFLAFEVRSRAALVREAARLNMIR